MSKPTIFTISAVWDEEASAWSGHCDDIPAAADAPTAPAGSSTTPEDTEQALYAVTDARWWSYLNLYLVTWGQNCCRPVYPRCDDCAVVADCPRLGVTKVGHSRKGES